MHCALKYGAYSIKYKPKLNQLNPMGQIRITGGLHRSRKLNVDDQPGLRPTTDRIRETLFNWLGQNLTGWAVLDLYAGSGALAFEAASRHAESVICVENNPKTLQQIKQNILKLDLQQTRALFMTADAYLQQCKSMFDLVFLDPPFGSNEMEQISGIIARFVKPGKFLYREYGDKQEIAPMNPDVWTLWKQKKAGQVIFEIWQKNT